MPYIRDVRLRATGLMDMSLVHQNVALRAHIDLRDNRISELQHEMRGLRQRLQRLNLHDNPLSEATVRYLDEARGAAKRGHGEVQRTRTTRSTPIPVRHGSPAVT